MFDARRPGSGAARSTSEALFRAHGRLVAGLCRGLLRDAHEAEDAAQQTFLLAHRAIARGEVPREPAAWLSAIARNECLGRIRERMARPLAIDADTLHGESDPVAEALRNADVSALWRALGALSQQQRDALLLREFGGLSYAEVAVALGVTVPAVESLIFRARTHLRGRLRAIAAVFNGGGELLLRLLSGGGAAKIAATAVAAGVVAGGGAVVGSHHAAGPKPTVRAADPAAIAADLGPARIAVAKRASRAQAPRTAPPRSAMSPKAHVVVAQSPPPAPVPQLVVDTAPPSPGASTPSVAADPTGGPPPTIVTEDAASAAPPSGEAASTDVVTTPGGDNAGESSAGGTSDGGTSTTPADGGSDGGGSSGPDGAGDG